MNTKLALSQMTSSDRQVIMTAMDLVLSGRFISDRDFQTRLGVSREEMVLVRENLSTAEQVVDELAVWLSVNNSLNEVCYGLRLPEVIWQQWFAASRDEVKAIFERWRITAQQP